MKAFALFAAALALVGCQKSIDQQFDEMCADQKANDPEVWAMSKGACENGKNAPDEAKKAMLDGYAGIKEARATVEDGR